MVTTYQYNTRETPQSEPIPGSTQVANNAGGFAWALDDWKRLERFLILGTEGGTFYVKERALTLENAEVVRRCATADGARTVSMITEISDTGRAVKNDPAIFALAICFAFGDVDTRRMARNVLPLVCRIGTHLFHFAEFVQRMRGWGRVLKGAVADWYDQQEVERVAYDIVKYRQRDGWSHKDLIILSHPNKHGNLYDYVVHDRSELTQLLPGVVADFERLQKCENTEGDAKVAAKIIADSVSNVPRECVPTYLLNYPVVWEALLSKYMPLEALVRNLATMTKLGVIAPFSAATEQVVKRLHDESGIIKARLHPLKLLVAQRTYATGKSMRGDATWTPVPQVIDALDSAFYSAFGAVTPTGKNIMLALDVSGSMGWGDIAGMPITPREGTAAMALVTAAVEPNYMITAFSHELRFVNISKGQRLADAMHQISNIPMGGTDCSLPMVHALQNKLPVDAFVVYTDNETWAGKIHPAQALRKYNEIMGRNAKLVVVGMTATEFSIADPKSANMLDVVGFDTATPEAISEFIR